VPSGNPDAVVKERTSVKQAALYRLSGDLNPLHIDAQMAAMGGFDKPILHGMCSLGFSLRHVMAQYLSSNPDAVKAIKVRCNSSSSANRAFCCILENTALI